VPLIQITPSSDADAKCAYERNVLFLLLHHASTRVDPNRGRRKEKEEEKKIPERKFDVYAVWDQIRWCKSTPETSMS
jgi:hypothetical protein